MRPDEDIVADPYAGRDEGERLNPATVADAHAIPNPDMRMNRAVVSDCALPYVGEFLMPELCSFSYLHLHFLQGVTV